MLAGLWLETAGSNLRLALHLLYGLNSNSVGWVNNLFYNIFFLPVQNQVEGPVSRLVVISV